MAAVPRKKRKADPHLIESNPKIMFGKSAAGAPDEKVLEIAKITQSLLVTFDKDFGELVFLQQRASGGVLLVRLWQLPSRQQASIVSDMVQKHGKTRGTFFCSHF